jgi:hypothetical protein
MRYTVYNCLTDVSTEGVQWMQANGSTFFSFSVHLELYFSLSNTAFLEQNEINNFLGVIIKPYDAIKPSEIVTTCAFYRTNWYECSGVADCSHDDRGVLTCAGAAPWRGFYAGSPEQGLISFSI